jgi:hypothetical protein
MRHGASFARSNGAFSKLRARPDVPPVAHSKVAQQGVVSKAQFARLRVGDSAANRSGHDGHPGRLGFRRERERGVPAPWTAELCAAIFNPSSGTSDAVASAPYLTSPQRQHGYGHEVSAFGTTAIGPRQSQPGVDQDQGKRALRRTLRREAPSPASALSAHRSCRARPWHLWPGHAACCSFLRHRKLTREDRRAHGG